MQSVRKILFLCLAVVSCRSVEFIPDREYANRRRSEVTDFKFFSRKPDMTVAPLGRLIFRNIYGNPGSEDFQREVAEEGRARGASCGYVSKRQISRQTQFRTNAMDQANKHGGATGEVESDVELVEVTLFQCEDK